MSACRARSPRRSEPKLSNAARRSACGCRRDAGWPGKRGVHRARSPRGSICTRWQRAREPTTGQATVVVVPNAAAQLPQRRGVLGRRRAGRPRWTAHRARSSVPRGRRRLPRCAAPRAHLCWHTRLLAQCPAAAHRRWPSLRRWAGVRARLATAERSRARPRGAPVACAAAC